MGLLLKIFQLLGASFGKDAIKFSLFKIFISSLVIIALPIALSMAATVLLSGIYDRVNEYATTETSESGLESVIMNVTGLAAFFVNHLFLIESFNVVMSAIALRVVLNFIPFSKL